MAVIALSWLGLVIHNIVELTGQARLGPPTIDRQLYLSAAWTEPKVYV